MFSKFIFLQSYETTLIKNYLKLLAFLNPCLRLLKMVGLRKNLGLFSNFGLPGGSGIYELRQNKAYYAVLQVCRYL